MKTIEQIAQRQARSMDQGQFHEDTEPQELAWLLRQLVRKIHALERQLRSKRLRAQA